MKKSPAHNYRLECAKLEINKSLPSTQSISSGPHFQTERPKSRRGEKRKMRACEELGARKGGEGGRARARTKGWRLAGRNGALFEATIVWN